MTIRLKGRAIHPGKASGRVIKSSQPISFLGGVDPASGAVIEKGHPLEGRKIGGKILVIPEGKGSTVGSYIIYRLKKLGIAPKAMILKKCDSIICAGAIISDIPCIDLIDIEKIEDGQEIEVENEWVIIKQLQGVKTK